MKRNQIIIIIALLAGLLCCGTAYAGPQMSLYLLCSEGLKNDGEDTGSTSMAVTFDERTGKIRLLTVSRDTFVEIPGVEIPDHMDRPYRIGGPEASLSVFNETFSQDIAKYVSISFLDLAAVIDDYGGVTVDLSRAERNAINTLVDRKKKDLKNMQDLGLLEKTLIDKMSENCYLEECGEKTQLNGLQAVAYGWLQYDSMADCCERENEVISSLIRQIRASAEKKTALYRTGESKPAFHFGVRNINLDSLSEGDRSYLYKLLKPVFEHTSTNLTKEEITELTVSMAGAFHDAEKTEIVVETMIFPLEARDRQDQIAGKKGHIIDKAKNGSAMKEFLYGE